MNLLLSYRANNSNKIIFKVLSGQWSSKNLKKNENRGTCESTRVPCHLLTPGPPDPGPFLNLYLLSPLVSGYLILKKQGPWDFPKNKNVAKECIKFNEMARLRSSRQPHLYAVKTLKYSVLALPAARPLCKVFLLFLLLDL
ncbi:hypothetical protein Bpfe_023642 [Biomphalaria pfeifferi]|uniref:Uncharacterized protein n=1 Tax=Biomphalaria pfeifferi TaxID=112525 RepID=A0AAD8B2L2_BIOPF|nr:hypothetical protein Bpfe_023642 [Biomphalaria pfeifferi]